MIPLRVELKNFLCHSEQVFDFEGEPVWLLHGPNGVGKSAVFDAMLYCLFGEYQRRERSDVKIGDLLRHGEASMEVKFDFEYRGKRYRVWRGRTRRGASSQGVSEFVDGQPVPISSINQKGDLDRWVLDTLGLSEEAFVSAVLLRQGNAERLIDKKSKERDQIFEGIIDLEPFKVLHEQAVEARRVKNAELTNFKRQLELKKPVAEAEIAAASGLVTESAAKWEAAQAAAGAARDLIEQARHWEALHGELTALQGLMKDAESRRLQAERLERDVARLKELRATLPILERVRKSQSDTKAATTAQEAVSAKKQDAQTRSDAVHDAIAKLRTTLSGLQEDRRKQTEELNAVESQLKSLRDEIVRAEQAAELNAALAADKKSLAAIPADLDERLAAAEAAVADAQSARDALPSLRTLQQQGTTYRAAAKTQKTAGESATTLIESVAEARVQDAAALAAEKTAAEALTASREADAAVRERVNAVKAAQEQLKSVKGKKQCSVCLQPIGPEHIENEGRELANKLKLAVAELAESVAAGEERKREADSAKQRREKTSAELSRVEKSHEQAIHDRDGAVNAADDSRKCFQTALAEMAEPWKAKVAAIEVEGFPVASDVDAAMKLAAGLAASKAELTAMTRQQQERMQLSAAVEKGLKAVAAIGAPIDVSASRSMLVELEKTATALKTRQADSDRRHKAAETEEKAKSLEVTKLNAELSAAGEAASTAAAMLAVAEHELNRLSRLCQTPIAVMSISRPS